MTPAYSDSLRLGLTKKDKIDVFYGGCSVKKNQKYASEKIVEQDVLVALARSDVFGVFDNKFCIKMR